MSYLANRFFRQKRYTISYINVPTYTQLSLATKSLKYSLAHARTILSSLEVFFYFHAQMYLKNLMNRKELNVGRLYVTLMGIAFAA